MNSHDDKTQANRSQSAANDVPQKQHRSNPTFHFVDNRPETAVLRKIRQMVHNYSAQVPQLFQKKVDKERSDMSQQAGEIHQSPTPVVQRVIYPTMDEMWAHVIPGEPVATVTGVVNRSAALQQAYADSEANIGSMNFLQADGVQPNAAQHPNPGGDYNINYGLHEALAPPYNDLQHFVGAILHEMMHVSAAMQYNQNAAAGGVANIANMNLPEAEGAVVNPDTGLDARQQRDMLAQINTMDQNWDNLTNEIIAEHDNETLTVAQRNFLIGANNIGGKIGYARGILPMSHYDSVLIELVYYFEDQGLTGTRSGQYAERLLAEANVRRAAGIGAVAPVARAWNWPCYITTACVQYKGLPDDCEELTVLRSFRDNYLLERKDGKELLKLYYDYSPLILHSIKRREEEEEILARLYRIIKTCVEAIKNGHNEIAYSIYCKMVVELKEEFIPEIKVSGNRSLQIEPHNNA